MKKFQLILNFISKREKFLPLFLVAIGLSSFQIVSAQKTPTPKPTPKITIVAPDVRVITPRPVPTPPRETKTVVQNESLTPAEKSISVESKVNVSLCVREGNVRINGWDRDEIRAYVENGSEVGFIVVDKSPKNQKPVWVKVLGFDPQKNKQVKPEDCLSGSEIELDVPRNAFVQIKSHESEIRIESVARAYVENLGGDIYLNEISDGVQAGTYRGDITVENSGGQIVLTNADGNILAIGVSPSEIGDFFKAKTNSGRITLSGVEHRQIETGTITGSINYDGNLLNGGQYGFSTTNGSIVLAVPKESLCKINAWFGFGAFASEIPLQNALKKEQSLSAQLGAGDATCSLNLKTGSGVIRLRNSKTPAKETERTFQRPARNLRTVSLNQKKTPAFQSEAKKP